MSYTEIFGFNKNGDAYHLADISNAWRGAMAVWNYLGQKHLKESFTLFGNADSFFKRLNAKLVKGEMNEDDGIVLYTTCDYLVVKKNDFQKVINAFRKFKGETSLNEQADVVEQALDDKDCIAIGWNQNSVNGDNWCNYGGYDEDKNEHIPYNINSGDKHWYMFEDDEED